MIRTIYCGLAIAIALAIGLSSCKKEKLDVVNKNFNVELRQPQGATAPRVGEQLPFQILIKGFDLENNKANIETYFYVRNEEGESTGIFTTTNKEEISIGKNFEYDYRKNNMALDFLYTPTQDGDQMLVVEIRCQGVSKSATFPISLKTKSIIVTATGGGKVQHNGKIETSFSLLLKYGETASFKAIPQERHKFTGWFLDGKKLSSSIDYVLRAEKDARIEARFKSMSYEINPVVNIAEAGTAYTTTGRKTFEDGDLVEVRVDINEKHKNGYIFKGWYVDGQLVSDKLTYAFNAKDDVSPEARFDRKTYVFSYNKENPGVYEIRLENNPALRQTIQYGKEYRIFLKAYLQQTARVETRMFFELGEFELNGRTGSSIEFNSERGGTSKQGTYTVICRGNAHVRVRRVREIDPGNDRDQIIQDEYVDL